MLTKMFDCSFSVTCVFCVCTALLAVLYQCILRHWSYFSDRNVKFVRGIPLLGSSYKSIIGIEPAAISYRRLYERFPCVKFIGIYDFGGRPSFLIRNPDVVKQLLVTDAHHFANQHIKFDNECDLFAYNLFGENATKLNDVEMSVNSIFGGNRMHDLHTLIVNSSKKFIEILKETDKTAKMFDSRDLFSRYANDVIANAAFGIDMNSIQNIDSEFFKSGCSLSTFRHMDGLKFLASFSFPSLLNYFNRMNGDGSIHHIRNILNDTIKSRKHQTSDKSDIIDLLLKAKNGQLDREVEPKKTDIGFAAIQAAACNKSNKDISNCSDDDIMKMCLIFFVSSLSSISSIASFMFHELAMNPDIQNKLFTEIEAINQQLCGQSLKYDSIPKMKYFDMVICETLRRWCPIPFLERTCSSPYTLEDSNGGKIELQIGDGIIIPTYALHMDREYYPKPLKFDPERFNDENRSSIRAGTYFPFGIGRNCFETQFSLMTIKVVAFHLLSEFYIDKSYKTQDPLKLKATSLLMDAENGFYIELRRRQPDRTPFKSQVFT